MKYLIIIKSIYLKAAFLDNEAILYAVGGMLFIYSHENMVVEI